MVKALRDSLSLRDAKPRSSCLKSTPRHAKGVLGFPFQGSPMSLSCTTIDHRLINVRRNVLYLTLVWALVLHPKLETYAIRLAGFAEGD